MRFRLDPAAARDDAYLVLPCAALAKGEFSWVPLHPCPFRGRYRIGDLDLCGTHAGMAEIEIQEERIPTMTHRLHVYAPVDPKPVTEWVRVRRSG